MKVYFSIMLGFLLGILTGWWFILLTSNKGKVEQEFKDGGLITWVWYKGDIAFAYQDKKVTPELIEKRRTQGDSIIKEIKRLGL